MTSILHQLRDNETRIAEDMTSVLDFLSRLQQGIDEGNWHYAQDKIPDLVRVATRLRIALNMALKEKQPARQARPTWVVAAISEFARHYQAGRVLYPVRRDHDPATNRRLLERVARDIQATPPAGATPADVDRLTAILRDYATGGRP